MVSCPECGSKRLYRDGLRELSNGSMIQRWLCRKCGYRFSQADRNSSSQSQHVEKISTQSLNRASTSLLNRQVCESLTRGSKNLDTTVEIKTTAGSISPTSDIKGIIAKYLAYLEREGYAKEITYPEILHTLFKRGANLYDGESVKKIIAQQPWKNSYKALATFAYDAFAKMEKLTWNPPRYKQEDAIVYVPEEKELDQLIAACRSRRMAAFLLCLKETFADPGEILGLRWIDLHGNILTINKPVKRHLAGQVTVSQKLVSALNCLPKTSERIFPTNYVSMRLCFTTVRNRVATMTQNPRIRSITFKSYRHWGGTMLAHYTNGNVLTVKKMLRHRAIQSTMKYIGMLQFKDDDYEVATATTVEEIRQLAQIGYQKFDEVNGIHVYRKPKKFTV